MGFTDDDYRVVIGASKCCSLRVVLEFEDVWMFGLRVRLPLGLLEDGDDKASRGF